MTHKGSCHCGQIAFEVDAPAPTEVMECNCSMCGRKGALLWFVPASQFQLETPEDMMKTYTFNKHVIQHHFCPKCGVAPFSRGKDPKGNAVAAINVRCIPGLDATKLKVKFFDGAKL